MARRFLQQGIGGIISGSIIWNNYHLTSSATTATAVAWRGGLFGLWDSGSGGPAGLGHPPIFIHLAAVCPGLAPPVALGVGRTGHDCHARGLYLVRWRPLSFCHRRTGRRAYLVTPSIATPEHIFLFDHDAYQHLPQSHTHAHTHILSPQRLNHLNSVNILFTQRASAHRPLSTFFLLATTRDQDLVVFSMPLL